MTKVLLITPPFTQLNTPYPATAYIKGYLNTLKVDSTQMDLGIETILKIFSRTGLEKLFASADVDETASLNAQRIYALRTRYIQCIDSAIDFLQDADPTLAHHICQRNFLPEASKFAQLEDLEWAFGTMGIRDQARHIVTLFLEDISDFIVEKVDSHFGFSRYAERLGMSANSFDDLYENLASPNSFITTEMLSVLKLAIRREQPDLVCLSVPFPGNLFAAFKCGQWLKQNHPQIKIAMGGGYPNTELRSVSDPRVFEFLDFITLDDGETPLKNLLAYLGGDIEISMLKRTFTLLEGKVTYCNESLLPDVKQEQVGCPDYTGLPLKKYLSVIQLTNPMHRLWSDGRWNKLTMAHGCYWGKCTFCDISLDYIKNYEASSAKTLVDRMETLIAQTGERGFHFVDEAAPPKLMKALALEILKRNLVVSWWTNIRFEKSFNYDLCRLLAASGCIAVSGGLEVASDRLLDLIAKGVTVEQVTQVSENFNRSGIMVHAYLMYGFPTQTAQETIDSLEVVRQLFEEQVLQSAFWHQFAMTAHSPVGMLPKQFQVEIVNEAVGTFANNDLEHRDPSGCDHPLFSGGLKKSLYNYMHGVGLDFPLQEWFEHEVPRPSISSKLIARYLEQNEKRKPRPEQLLLWLGGPVKYNNRTRTLAIDNLQEAIEIPCDQKLGKFLGKYLLTADPKMGEEKSIKQFESDLQANKFELKKVWNTPLFQDLQELGLVHL